jgi:hypothetical protein
MSLSLDAIYKPMNDFFLKKFNVTEKSPTIFLLESSGSAIDEKDFAFPYNPEEVFSDLVNRVPVVENNKINVSFLSNNIDNTYEWVLSALPFIPRESGDREREMIEQTYSRVWARARHDWRVSKKAKGGGVADTFLFTEASPLTWYQKESPVWETHAMEITESRAATTKKNKDPNRQILKIRLDDAQLNKVITAQPLPGTFNPKKTANPFLKMNLHLNLAGFNLKGDKKKPVARKATRISRDHRTGFVKTDFAFQTAGPKKTNLGKSFSAAYHNLRLNEKIIVKDAIKKNSPTRAVNTNKVSIRFQYCLVRFQRDWLSEGIFFLHKLWYIPGMSRGALNDPAVGGLTYLPIAFAAVKDLKITANWQDVDKNDLQNATSFGPFDIHHEGNVSEKSSLTRSGIQIVGWILQKMPVLPPQGPAIATA